MKRLRKILLLPAMMLLVFALHAQVEVKTNPIAFLFTSFPVKAEYVIANHWGAELGLGYHNYNWLTKYADEDFDYTCISAHAAIKHYFKPSAAKGGDRFYAFFYNKFSSCTFEEVKVTNDALGFGVGYKWVSQKNVILETGLGFGRNFYSKVDGEEELGFPFDTYFRLDLGYRFDMHKKK